MKELERIAELEKDAPPSTVMNAWQRAFGGDGNGIPALQVHGKKRERAEAMNAELAARGCKTVDLEWEPNTRAGSGNS